MLSIVHAAVNNLKSEPFVNTLGIEVVQPGIGRHFQGSPGPGPNPPRRQVAGLRFFDHGEIRATDQPSTYPTGCERIATFRMRPDRSGVTPRESEPVRVHPN